MAVALVLTVASIWLATRLEIHTDQLELISTRHPLISLSNKLDAFGFHGKTTFAVVVQGPDQERSIEFMKALVEKIHSDPKHFQEVFYRIDPEKFKKWMLYYLDQDDLIKIRQRIEEHSDLVDKMAQDPDVLDFLKLVNQEMASKMVGEFFTGFLDEDKPKNTQAGNDEPMDLGFLIKALDGFSRYLSGDSKFVSPWAAFFKSGSWDLEKEGYIWEGKKKFLVAAVVPTKIKGGVSKTLKSLDVLRRDIRQLQSKSFPDVQAGVTGQEALNDDEMSTALRDMTVATWLSLGGVLLIMALFFRGFRNPMIEMVSLGVGLCWTFGWTALFIGHLNILSIVFAPMLSGIGVDYGIHWFARFEEERRLNGSDLRAVIKRVMDKSGPGIMLAAMSTGFAFLPFLLTGFRGLMELGMITGMGILLTLLADFTILPSLTPYFSASPSKSKKPAKPSRQYLFRMNRTGVRAVLAVSLILCVLSAFGASRVGFDLNPLRLQSPNVESVKWEKLLVESSEHSVLSASSIANSAQEVRAKAQRMEALPVVADVSTVFSLLPENQEEKVPLLRSLLASVPNLDQMLPKLTEGAKYASIDTKIASVVPAGYRKQLTDTLERISFKMQEDQAKQWGASKPLTEQMHEVKDLSEKIIQALRGGPESAGRLSEFRLKFRNDIIDKWNLLRESSAAPPMRVEDLPGDLRDQFLQNGLYLLRIYPKESIWDEGSLTRFITSIQTVDPNVVGDPVSLFVFSSAYRKASTSASIYALIAISLLLTLIFRSLRLTLIALVPLVVGTLWTIGIMGATGMDFNLANSIFMPLVVGVGVEYGVIILHRWREGGVAYGGLPFSTAKGVILAALTTTIGFGALMISHHRGIFSLGFVACVGSICVLASAILILPAILSGQKPIQPAVKEGEVNNAS